MHLACMQERDIEGKETNTILKKSYFFKFVLSEKSGFGIEYAYKTPPG